MYPCFFDFLGKPHISVRVSHIQPTAHAIISSSIRLSRPHLAHHHQPQVHADRQWLRQDHVGLLQLRAAGHQRRRQRERRRRSRSGLGPEIEPRRRGGAGADPRRTGESHPRVEEAGDGAEASGEDARGGGPQAQGRREGAGSAPVSERSYPTCCLNAQILGKKNHKGDS